MLFRSVELARRKDREHTMSTNTLTITDNRTGKSYDIPINSGAIHASDLRKLKLDDKDYGLMSYDPAFTNTASTKSSITYLDGDAGQLYYRGYPIEQLAEKSNHLETAYLILNGELPTKAQFDSWEAEIGKRRFVHENIKDLIDAFRHDAHPMGMFISAVAALSSFYPESVEIFDPAVRREQIIRLIAKVPTIAAFSYRHLNGLPVVYPDDELSYTANFVSMMFKRSEIRYKLNPVLVNALDVLFLLHADHEQNCSTNTMRAIGSAYADPYVALAGAAAALYGPLHGGANEETTNE